MSIIKHIRKIDQEKFKGLSPVSGNRDYLPIITDSKWVNLVIGRMVWVWSKLEEA